MSFTRIMKTCLLFKAGDAMDVEMSMTLSSKRKFSANFTHKAFLNTRSMPFHLLVALFSQLRQNFINQNVDIWQTNDPPPRQLKWPPLLRSNCVISYYFAEKADSRSTSLRKYLGPNCDREGFSNHFWVALRSIIWINLRCANAQF